MKTYNPKAKNKKILEQAMAILNKVPYRPSLRWLFYNLLQLGICKNKAEYKPLKDGCLSTARKRFYNGWSPTTLTDDTRQARVHGWFYDDINEWINKVVDDFTLTKWFDQDYYIEIWYEAKAMTEQFKHITENKISLVAFGGDPSIPFKYSIAKRLENASEIFEKPIVILYFGDLDPKGEQIPKSAVKDIREWCNADFKFIPCGINKQQVKKYKVPENPDKPNEYQWEALSHESAQEIITSAVNKYLNKKKFKALEQQEKKTKQKLREFASKLDI